MLTPTDVANYALAANDLEPIASIDEASDRAKLIKPIWKPVFETFLAEHSWSFARALSSPARLAPDSKDPEPFRYAYALPEDCIKLVNVTLPAAFRIYGDPVPKLPQIPYEVRRLGERGRAILANEENIIVEYVSNRTRIDDFTPQAYEALALKLAFEISLNIKNNNARAQVLLQRHQAALGAALVAEDATRDRPRLGGCHYSDARIV